MYFSQLRSLEFQDQGASILLGEGPSSESQSSCTVTWWKGLGSSVRFLFSPNELLYFIFFLFHCGLLQDIEYSSLCSAIVPCCFQSHHPNPTVYQEKNKKIKVILAIISLVILKISRFLSISQKSFLFFKLKYGLFTIFCYSRVYSNIIHVYIIHMYAYFSDSFPLQVITRY